MIKIKRFCLKRDKFIDLLKKSRDFNSFNTSLEKYYYSKPRLLRFFIKDIRYIYLDKALVGYFWFEKIYEKTYSIKDLVIDRNLGDELNKDKDKFFERGLFIYECEDSNFSNSILKSLGFRKTSETLLMKKDITAMPDIDLPNNISFKFMENNKEEELRCNLQNNIFEEDSRIPLTLDDIYYDQCQEYYLPNSSVFIRNGNEAIGYGQIIFNNGSYFIVNLGIVKEYRGMGFSTYLLNHLVNIAYSRGIKEIAIRVDKQNEIAKKLYSTNGFRFVNNVSIWEQ